MDFSALVIGVEMARRDARSALPCAPVRKPSRARHILVAIRRIVGGSPPA